MNSKSFQILSVTAVIAVVLAAVSVSRQPKFESTDFAGERVFPALAGDLAKNKLKTVVIRQREETYRIDRDGATWRVRERDNFAADSKKVDELILKIARLDKLEGKTSLPERYERLDLQEPDAKDSRAKEVKLLDSDGKELASLVVGKRKFTLGSKEGGTYIRLPGTAQTFLASGELSPGEKMRDWLVRDVVDIKDKQIKKVTVQHPDGEKVIVGKEAATDPSFKILNLPAGMEPASDFAADDFGRVLSVFLLDDVKKDSGEAFPADKTIRAEFEGFDGFRVLIDYAELDGQNWVKVRAEAPSAATPPQPAGSGTTAGATGATAEPATDWAAKVAEINARSTGWVFQVPAYEVNALKKKMAELAKKPEAKADAKS